MTPVEVPVILFTLEDVRERVNEGLPSEDKIGIGTIRKAARDGTLRALEIDKRTVVVTPQDVEDYIRKRHESGRYRHQRARKRRKSR